MSASDRPATGPIPSVPPRIVPDPNASASIAPGSTAPGSAVHDSMVAITGLGAVTAWGWAVEPTWQGLLSGEAAIGEPRSFDTTGHRTRLASEVIDDPDDPRGPPREWVASPWWNRSSRADRFAVAAALEACGQADLEPSVRGLRTGVYFGGSTAAMDEGEVFFRRLVGAERGHPRISPLATHPLDGPGNAIARALGVRGPVESLSSACASGGLALGSALDALRSGEVDVALAGGADALCQLTYAGFNSLRAVDEDHCAPFRRDRAGLNLGEGAGALVLETVGHARRRGRQPIALLLGAGASCDAHHMTAPHPEGEGASRAILAALENTELETGALGQEPGQPPVSRQGLDLDDIGFVNAHGTGTPHNDRAEWRALGRVFGERARRLPVTSTKGLLGHFLGSSGAIEAVVTALCLRSGLVHPTPGRGPIDPDLDVDLVVGEARPTAALAAVSTSFAFGGSNAALILGRYPSSTEQA